MDSKRRQSRRLPKTGGFINVFPRFQRKRKVLKASLREEAPLKNKRLKRQKSSLELGISSEEKGGDPRGCVAKNWRKRNGA
jgi:hypothetical protein